MKIALGLYRGRKKVHTASGYDAKCAHCVHFVERFLKNFPEHAEEVKNFCHIIPSLHIEGHGEDCMVLFGPAYKPCIGHFFGETAEYYWPESNQLGAFTCQMNPGHRHDTIIDHHSDWNFKKTINMSTYSSSCPQPLLTVQNRSTSTERY
jgi:hypothetical protein